MQLADFSHLESFKRLTPAGKALLEKQLIEGPSREVGKSVGACSGLFPSRLSPESVPFDSAGQELCYLHLMVLDPTVIHVCGQVHKITVVRNGKYRKKKSVSNVRFDYLTVREKTITIVEVKPLEMVEKFHAKHPDEWVKDGDRWRFLPGEEAAARLGMEFEVFVPLALYSRIYLFNLEALVSANNYPVGLQDARLVKKAAKLLADGPLSINEICAEIAGMTGTVVLKAILDKQLFAMLSVQKIDEQILVFSSDENAKRREQDLMKMVPSIGDEMTSLSARFMRITETEYNHALKVEEKYHTLVTKRVFNSFYYRYVSKVKQAEEQCAPPITAFVPNFRGRGANDSLYGKDEQGLSLYDHVKAHLKIYLLTAHKEHIGRAYQDFKTYLGSRFPTVPCFQTYSGYYHSVMLPENRANLLYGLRGYQGAKSSTDTRLRNLHPTIPGLVAHMDTTPGDAIAKQQRRLIGKLTSTESKEEEERPLIVPVVDSATGYVMGRGINIGTADRLLVGTAQRDCVARCGVMPQRIIRDKGKEMTNHAQKQLSAAIGETFQNRPSAGATHGSEVERFYAELNSFLQSLPGSKYPDQKGRSADASKKSRATAEYELAKLIEIIDNWIFNIYNRSPKGDENLSPEQLFYEGRKTFPSGAIVIKDDDAFKFLTSMPLQGKSYSRKQGFRFANEWYSSPDMKRLLNTRKVKIVEMRLDCVNPSLIWAQTTSGILPLLREDNEAMTKSSLPTKAANYVRLFEYHPKAKANQSEKTKKEVGLIQKAATGRALNEKAAISSTKHSPNKTNDANPPSSSNVIAFPTNIPTFKRKKYVD